MEWWVAGLSLFLGMFLLLFLGINIPFSLGIVSVIGIIVVWNNPIAGFIVVANEAYHRGTNFLFLAVPMFILLAEVIVAARFSEDAYDAVCRFLCRVPGSLSVATVALSAVFAALTGSSLANAVIVGRVAIGEMTRYKYAKSLAAGVVAAGGTLGILIPPSIPMIFYGFFSEESIAKLFMAGVVPGIMISLMFASYVIIRVKLNPQLAPPVPTVGFVEAMKKSYKIFPVIGLILFMFAGFYFGLATPTEIAGVGAFVAFLIAITYRRLKWQGLKAAGISTAKTTAMLMWILIGALAFGTVLAYAKFPQNLTKLVVELPLSPMVILFAINVFLLVMGCILETGAIMMIIWPLLIAVAKALGFDLIWFAVILVIQMELGQITPPVGLILFAMPSIAPDIRIQEVYRGIAPFVFLLIVAIGIIIIFPQIALWLPSLM